MRNAANNENASVNLNVVRSRLYRQLRRRAKSHFAQNHKLYQRIAPDLRRACKNTRKPRRAKIRRPRLQNLRMTRVTLDTLILEREENKKKTRNAPTRPSQSVLSVAIMCSFSLANSGYFQKEKIRRFRKVTIKTSFQLFYWRKRSSFSILDAPSYWWFYRPLSAKAHTSFSAKCTLHKPSKINKNHQKSMIFTTLWSTKPGDSLYEPLQKGGKALWTQNLTRFSSSKNNRFHYLTHT